jgi:hypothetical protein
VRRSLPLAILLLVAVAGAGFWYFSQRPDAVEVPLPAPAPGVGTELGPAQLGVMTLPRQAFGVDADGLRLDARTSGVHDNAERAAQTPNDADTAETLAAAGRETGFVRRFLDTDLSSVVDGGVLEASSAVEVYADEEAAAAAILEELVDLELAASDRGAARQVLSVDTFPVAGLTDALGVRVRAKIADVPVARTTVRFRHGSVVGTVTLVRTDGRTPTGRAVDLARKVDRRIAGVMDGGATPQPAADAVS